MLKRSAARIMARERLVRGVASTELDKVVRAATADTWHIGAWRDYRATFQVAPHSFALDLVAPILGDPEIVRQIDACVRQLAS